MKINRYGIKEVIWLWSIGRIKIKIGMKIIIIISAMREP